MAETDGTRQPNDKPGRQTRQGQGRWFYGSMAVLAVAGAALVFVALRPTSDEPAVQGRDETETAATTASTGPTANSATAESSAGQQQAEFPAEFDTLGVSIGPEDAPLVVREFGDYQCPACGAFAPATKSIRDEYVASGKIRFVFFDIPLTEIHANALVSAQAARCAGKQGDYWAMHDTLFENQDEWSAAAQPAAVDHFAAYATDIGLDADALQRCVESEETREAVERSHAFAIGIGVRSTPSMLVGNVPIVGSLPYERVRGLIEEQLAAR